MAALPGVARAAHPPASHPSLAAPPAGPRSAHVERSFGWLAHWGGLLRDRAGRLDVAAARIACAAVLAATQALINPA